VAGNCHNQADNQLEETLMQKSSPEVGEQNTWLQVCDDTSADDNFYICFKRL